MKYDQPTIFFKNTVVNSIRLILFLYFLWGSLLAQSQPVPGAANLNAYVPAFKGKQMGIATNHTAIIGTSHLVDTLLTLGIKIHKIFAPEHGFRGDAANGEWVQSSLDSKTNIPIVSLYGKNKIPKKEDLKDIDIMVFDMQDVGVRYFTYLSTLHYVMTACAEYHIPLWILDRHNPNGYAVDGPILDTARFSSMVGLHPIPILHGMTLGELAMMIKGEKWIPKAENLALYVVPVESYDHCNYYPLYHSPSPNLSTEAAILLYPSLGLFEGTVMSMGRGTVWPFEVLGAPWLDSTQFKTSFIPKEIKGKALKPPYQNIPCNGIKLTRFAIDTLSKNQEIHIEWLIQMYQLNGSTPDFFNAPSFFDKLSGNSGLRESIIKGLSASEIRKTWEPDLQAFRILRKPYMIYRGCDYK
jgi:uncharacterized protein YbbC (DUF1343 family)